MKSLKNYIVETKVTDNELYENIQWCLSNFLEFNDVDENYLLLAIDEFKSVYKALTEKNVKYDIDFVWKSILENYEHLIDEKINKNTFLNITKKYDKQLTENILSDFDESIKDLKDEIQKTGKLS